MKKLWILAFVFVLTLQLAGCGRRMEDPVTTTPSVNPPAVTTPSNPVDPTLDTNIPDPEVNPNSTMPGGITTDPSTGSEPDMGENQENDGQQNQQTPSEPARSRMRKIK